MRRSLLLPSLVLTLAACASVLGDFDVVPNSTTTSSSGDGGNLADGSSGTSGTSSGTSGTSGTSGSSGTSGTSGTSGNPDYEQPIGLAVATANSATCATVQYVSSGKTLT